MKKNIATDMAQVIKRMIPYSLVLICLVGCLAESTGPATSPALLTLNTLTADDIVSATSPASPTSTSTETPSLTAVMTPTVIPPLTPILVSTPTIPPNIVRYQCLEIDDQPPPDLPLNDIVVFNKDGNLDAFLVGLETGGGFFRFPREEGDRLSGFRVSPDRKRILYYHSSGDVNSSHNEIVIAGVDGQPIWSQSYSWPGIWDWLDDEHLVRWVSPITPEELPDLFLLNPFTGKQQELTVGYPGYSHLLIDMHWSGGAIRYDPTLTRVIYPECDQECREWLIRGEHKYPLVLWDTETEQVLIRLITMDVYGNTPIWSTDGSQFIIATNLNPQDPFAPANEFYAVSRDGQIRQSTHFTDYFQSVEIPDSYNLSPDGRFVAFWMIANPSPYSDDRLVVWDTETGEVTNYCITGDPFNLNVSQSPYSSLPPIWSPDSTQLLVMTRDPQDTLIRRVILVDIVHGVATQMGEDVDPVGWMVAP